MRRPRSHAAALIVICAVGAFTCKRKPSVAPKAPPEIGEVYADGCTHFAEGPKCLLAQTATVVLWVDTDADALKVEIDGRSQDIQWRRVEGGYQTRVVVAPSAKSVTLGAAKTTLWTMPVERISPIAWMPDVMKLYGDQKFEAAEAILDEIGPDRPLAERAEAMRMRGRIAWRRSDPKTAEIRTEAAKLAEEAGLLSLAVYEHLAAGHVYMDGSKELAAAWGQVELARSVSGDSFARGRVVADELAGQIERKFGDFRSSARTFERMAFESARIGSKSLEWVAELLAAFNHTAMGQPLEAIRRLDLIAGSSVVSESECNRAYVANHRSFSQLMAVEYGLAVDSERLEIDLRLARQLHSGSCSNRFLEGDDLHNLALSEIQQRRPRPARHWIHAARKAGTLERPQQALWHGDLEGRVALLDDRPRRALQAFDALGRLAARTSSPNFAWRAAVGSARAHWARKETEQTIAAYRRADDILERQSLSIALGDDRGAFLSSRERATRDFASVLLATGRTDELVSTIRKSRSRLLNHLDWTVRLAQLSVDDPARWKRVMTLVQEPRAALARDVREAWSLTDREQVVHAERRRTLERKLAEGLDKAAATLVERTVALPALKSDAGLVTVGYQETPDGWFGFAYADGRLHAANIPKFDLQAPLAIVASHLLLPFGPVLTNATRLRVLAPGRMQHIDFHALPYGDNRLIDHLEVEYALDLVPRPRSKATGHVLVVSDPHGNLPGARAEGVFVADALRARQLRVTELVGSGADARVVREALGGVDHFHYAGHAKFDGGAGWRSALELASDGRIEPGAIISRGRAPSSVFLSGCETAEVEVRAVVGLGLAHAFVLAGASTVIAASRLVDDATTAEIVQAVYSGDFTDLGVALRRAQRDVSRRKPEADWAAFRVLVP